MDCIFCKIVQGDVPSKKIYEDENLLAILDVNPCVNGHVLIIPKKHYTDYLELDSNISFKIFELAKKLGLEIMQKLKADSLTLLVNYGEEQKVKHFHLHLLPNYGKNEVANIKPVEEIYNILKTKE